MAGAFPTKVMWERGGVNLRDVKDANASTRPQFPVDPRRLHGLCALLDCPIPIAA